MFLLSYIFMFWERSRVVDCHKAEAVGSKDNARLTSRLETSGTVTERPREVVCSPQEESGMARMECFT